MLRSLQLFSPASIIPLRSRGNIITTALVYITFWTISFTMTDANANPVETVEKLDYHHVCATAESNLDKMGMTGVKVLDLNGNMKVEFTPNKQKEAIFETLTPCRDWQRFEVIVDSYLPDYIPDRIPSKDEPVKRVPVITKEGKQHSVPSCMHVLQQTTNMSYPGRCKIVPKSEKISCQQLNDTSYDPGDFDLLCSSNFTIDCDLTTYATPIEGKPKYNFFRYNFWADRNYEGHACKYKVRSIDGFRLLLNKKDAQQIDAEPMMRCIEENVSCPFPQTTTPANTTTTTSMTTVEPSVEPLSFSSCVGTWPFILLIVLLAIQLIIVLVLLILALVRNKKKEPAVEDEEDVQADMMRNAEPFMAEKTVDLGFGEQTICTDTIPDSALFSEYKLAPGPGVETFAPGVISSVPGVLTSAGGVEVPETVDETEDQPVNDLYDIPSVTQPGDEDDNDDDAMTPAIKSDYLTPTVEPSFSIK